MGTALQTQNPRVSGVLASILHEAPVGLCRARSRRWTNRMRERDMYTSVWNEEDVHDALEGRTETESGIRGSGYGAVCKCYDPLLCSSSLFAAVLPPRSTRSTMAPMGPREFWLLAFSR